MSKTYKPLTPPDKKAYEPYIKPKFVDDTTKKKSTKKFKAKKKKPTPLFRVCEKCHNIIGLDGYCTFCETQNTVRILTPLNT